MKFIKDMLLLILMVICTMEISKATVVVYKCRYNYNKNTEFIGTTSLKTQIVAKKTVKGLKYSFNIPNTKQLHYFNDYVTITNKEGKVITYALKCELI